MIIWSCALLHGQLAYVRAYYDFTAQVYLTAEEFQKIFLCSYEEFMNKPVWKQQQLKKSKQLF